MTIDERLEHLTQVVASQESNLNRLFDSVQELREGIQDLKGLQGRNETLMANVIEAIDSLSRVAMLHEKRIEDLEGGTA